VVFLSTYKYIHELVGCMCQCYTVLLLDLLVVWCADVCCVLLQLDFSNVFTEVEDTYTRSEFREAQQAIYKYSKLIYYNILSIFIGIPLSLLWGLIGALVMFILVWWVNPIIKLSYVTLYPLVSAGYTMLVSPWLVPLVDTFGRLLRQIHITIKKV